MRKYLYVMALAAVFLLLAGCAGAPPQTGTGGGTGGGSGDPSGGDGTGAGSGSSGTGSSGTGTGGAVLGRTNPDLCPGECASLGAESLVKQCTIGCYHEVAENTKNADMCDRIKTVDDASADTFYSACLSKVAEVSKSTVACERMASDIEKNICIGMVAQATGNAALCDKITDPMWKTSCIDGTKSG